MAGLSEQISGLSARIRVSEERMNEIRNKMLFIEQNLLSNHKKLLGELKMSNEEIDELRHKLTEVEDRIITIIKELRLTARKTDIDVMKRYIELWDPVKFVSADFAEKIAREVVEEKLSGRASDQNI
jgi:predicted  nucleic acid-binding Zn-ribbon protein